MEPFAIIAALLVLKYLVVRGGTLALMRTGLSRESAAFQAQSAFMGVGFTTSESESIVSHPIRRRVVSVLMAYGYVGIAATVSAVVLWMDHTPDDQNLLTVFGLLVVIVGGLMLLGRVPFVRRVGDGMIEWLIERLPALRIVDYEQLLQLDDGYAITEIPVGEGHWAAGRTLRQLRLADEGVLVLAVHRATGGRLGTPPADTELRTGDRLLLYGRGDAAARFCDRHSDASGDRERERAVVEQRAVLTEEEIQAERLEELVEESAGQEGAS